MNINERYPPAEVGGEEPTIVCDPRSMISPECWISPGNKWDGENKSIDKCTITINT